MTSNYSEKSSYFLKKEVLYKTIRIILYLTVFSNTLIFLYQFGNKNSFFLQMRIIIFTVNLKFAHDREHNVVS